MTLERENMDLKNEEMTLKQRLEHMQNTYLGFIEKGQIVFIENPTPAKSLALSSVSSNIGEALPMPTPWSRDITTPWPKEAGSSDQGSSLPREPVEPRETTRSGLPMTHDSNQLSSPHWPIPCNTQGKAFCLFCNM